MIDRLLQYNIADLVDGFDFSVFAMNGLCLSCRLVSINKKLLPLEVSNTVLVVDVAQSEGKKKKRQRDVKMWETIFGSK